jgi:OPA family glycerol-3-phosphate transporter-like MFS transporter
VDWFGWDGGFVLLIVGCVLAILCIVPTLKHDNIAAAQRASHAANLALLEAHK